MASDICVRFGRRIRDLRKKRGWTQVYLAEHTGLGSVYISQLEHGKKEPGLRTIEILAISFEMTPAQLLRGIHV
jgi:transcriptional regulator with XRE-family HTH domain